MPLYQGVKRKDTGGVLFDASVEDAEFSGGGVLVGYTTNAIEGLQRYNATLHRYEFYNGTAWVESSGAVSGGFTDFAATAVATLAQLVGKICVIDTALGNVDLTFPALGVNDDGASGVIIHDQNGGANLARLISGAASFLHIGGTASPFSLPGNGDNYRWIYRHSNTTVYLIG